MSDEGRENSGSDWYSAKHGHVVSHIGTVAAPPTFTLPDIVRRISMLCEALKTNTIEDRGSYTNYRNYNGTVDRVLTRTADCLHYQSSRCHQLENPETY